MGASYFIFKGVDSRSMSIVSGGAAPLIRAEERVEHVTIPGRSGDLTVTEGDRIFNSYIQTYPISVRGSENKRRVMDWLSGEGYVTFSTDPDRRQKARVIGAVTLNKVSKNMDAYTGEVQFYCHPLKEDVADTPVVLTEAGTVFNAGDVEARPRIRATGVAGESFTITSSSGTFTFSFVGSIRTVVIIDCDAEIVLTTDNVNFTYRSSGPFPRLAPGSVEIGGTGWSQLAIERRCRYL